MKPIKVIILLTLLLSAMNGQAQSKKELQKKYEDLQNKNLKLEKSNVLLNAQVANLTGRVERLEKELLIAKKLEKNALAAKELALSEKDRAVKTKEEALKAQIETLKSKEALLEEKSRMEKIFERETKGKSNLRQMSIAGRYYVEDDSNKAYIELFEDGTLYAYVGDEEKNSLLNSVGGTYKLQGDKITLIVSIFTMQRAIKGTIKGDRLTTISDEGVKTVHVREK